MGVTWEAWLLAALVAAAVMAGAPAWSIVRARRDLRRRVRTRLLPHMGEVARDLAAAAEDGELVALRGRLQVTGEPAKRFDDEAPVAVATAVCALSPSRLAAFDDQQVAHRAGQGLVLAVGGDEVALAGSLRVRAGDERRPAPSVDEAAEGLLDAIEVDLSERGREILALRSIPAGAEVLVRGRVERAAATSRRGDYRSAPTKWTLVPGEDDGALEVAQIAPVARESVTASRLVPGVIVAAVLLWLGPAAIDGWLHEIPSAAKAAASDCLDAYVRGEAELDGCLSRGDGVAMTLLSFLPSYGQEVDEARTSIRRWSARRVLRRATQTEPQADARSQAAERYLELLDDASAESMRDLFDAGAFAFVADRGEGLLAFEAALVLADVDRAKSLALAIAADGQASMTAHRALRLGAWLCLTGERAGGVAFLEGWLGRVSIDYEREALLLTMAACGGDGVELARRFLDPVNLEYVLAADPTYQTGRRRAVFRTLWESHYPDARRHVIASFHLGGEQEPPFADALALAHSSYDGELWPRARTVASAITAAHWNPDLVYLDAVPWAAGAAVAAKTFARLAEDPVTLPEHGSRPLEPHEVAIESPAPALQRAAWTMWLEAAVEHVRRGDLPAAREALAQADDLAPPIRRWMNAPAHLAADDAAGALEVLNEEPAQEDRKVRTSRLLLESEALAELGRKGEAYDVAKRAYDASGAKDDRAESYSEEGTLQLLASFQLAATALLAERADEASAVLGVGSATGDVVPDEAIPGRLLRFAKDGLGEDVPYWVETPGVHDAGWVWRAVLGGRALAHGHEEEVALDRAWSASHRERPRFAAWARWRAARLRGDEAAAKRWAGRVATLAAVAASDPTGVLAQVAGL